MSKTPKAKKKGLVRKVGKFLTTDLEYADAIVFIAGSALGYYVLDPWLKAQGVNLPTGVTTIGTGVILVVGQRAIRHFLRDKDAEKLREADDQQVAELKQQLAEAQAKAAQVDAMSVGGAMPPSTAQAGISQMTAIQNMVSQAVSDALAEQAPRRKAPPKRRKAS